MDGVRKLKEARRVERSERVEELRRAEELRGRGRKWEFVEMKYDVIDGDAVKVSGSGTLYNGRVSREDEGDTDEG